MCISKLTIIGLDWSLSHGRHQAIIWTNYGIFLIGPLGINFGDLFIEIRIFSFKKMHLKIASAKWGRFCPARNMLKTVHEQIPLHVLFKNGFTRQIRNPQSDGVAIECLSNVDGVTYFLRPKCTLQCRCEVAKWHRRGIAFQIYIDTPSSIRG